MRNWTLRLILIVLTVSIFEFSGAGCMNVNNWSPNETVSTQNNHVVYTDTVDISQDTKNIVNFDLENYEPNTYWAAVIYFTTLGIEFEEDDTVMVDELMRYYMSRGLYDSNFQVNQSLKQYETDKNLEFSIPKEIVHDFLMEHFNFKIDTNHSDYTDPNNNSNYLLSANSRGYDDILMKDVTVDGNLVTGNFMYANLRLGTVYSVRKICFEVIDEYDFRYVYARKTD